MPTYVWECPKCQCERDVIATVSARNDVQKCKCGAKMTRVITPAYSMPDIKPYQALTGDAVGREITGRKAHREFLKRNRLVEIGDAPVRDTSTMRPIHRKGEIKAELAKVAPEIIRRGSR